MPDLKVPFGKMPDGTIVSVETVERGLDCNCVCPGCSGDLVAAKGSLYRHHFRHAVESSCGGAPETALHRYAKQIICQALSLRLPDPCGTLTAARPEVRLDFGVVCDVLCDFCEPVAIEIWVAHQVPIEKVRSYNDAEMAALEIDLRSYRNADHGDADWAAIVLERAPRHWISAPTAIRAARKAERERWLAEQEARIREQQRLESEAHIQAEAAREETERWLAEQREKAAKRQAEYEAKVLAEAERRHADAEYRKAVAERDKRERAPPDLQALVVAHGGYDKITDEAWALFDHDRKVWQDKVAVGWWSWPDPQRAARG